jgi:YfiH family protein
MQVDGNGGLAMEPFVMSHTDKKLSLMYISEWQKRFPHVKAGFSTRLGGASHAPFDSLNCGLHVGDYAEDVIINRELVADAVGIPIESWVYAEQVHGCDVHWVTLEDSGKGVRSRESAIQAKDAFVTQRKNLCIGALFADCVPLYYYDPGKEAIGLAHAGWKGTVQQIAAVTVTKMQQFFASQPHEIFAAIGPSIGICCFEVDEVVMNKVWEVFGREMTWDEHDEPLYRVKDNGKFMLNLQEMNRQIMIKAGILPSHIEVSNLCTSCHSDFLFSHRKENGKTGRMVAWIGLT